MLLIAATLLLGIASTINLTDTCSGTSVGVSQLMLLRIKSSQDICSLPLGIEVVGEKPGEWIDVIISEKRLDELSGLNYEVIIQDASGYDNLVKDTDDLFAKYPTFDEIQTVLQGIESEYPNITDLYSLGTTYEGRDILCLEISDNPGVDEGEPGILFTGLHHANEWPTVNITLYIAKQLTSQYGSNQIITNIVNKTRLWIVPCVNPDGYYYSHDLFYPLWRKNRNGTGVDLNRNYGGSSDGDIYGAWGSIVSDMVSHNPNSDNYCGSSPCSEKECQAIKKLFMENNISAAINWHTYGEYVCWPWAYSTDVTPDNSYYEYVGEQIANRITRQDESGTYGAQQSNGITGNTNDWAYGYGHYVQGRPTFSYVIEACELLIPVFQSILNQICTENFDGALYLLLEAENIRNSVTPRVLPPVIDDMSCDEDGDYVVSWQEQNPDDNYGKGRFWVEAPDDIETDQKIWLYYGNNTVSTSSNGNDTFIMFDDFSYDSDNMWTETVSGSTDYYHRDLGAIMDNARLRVKLKVNDIKARNWASDADWDMALSNNSGAAMFSDNYVQFWSDPDTDEGATQSSPRGGFYTRDSSSGEGWSHDQIVTEGNAYRYEIRFTQTQSEFRIWDFASGSLIRSGDFPNYPPENVQYQSFRLVGGECTGQNEFRWVSGSPNYLKVYNEGSHYGCNDAWQDYHIYWLFVSGYASTEPSWGTIGSEENQSGGSQNWWNTDWSYRKLINISDAVNGYQMGITIDYDSGGDVSCGSNCQLDFDDIRFVDYDNNTELDFWLEEYTDPVYFQLEEFKDISIVKDDAEQYGGLLNWSYTTGDWVDSSPVVADCKVYVGSRDGNLYCLNAENGNLIWNYTTSYNVYSSPVVADGKVYVGSDDGNLYCLNAEDGSFIWSYPTSGGVYSSPVVADGRVYVGSLGDNLYCLNAEDGSFIWSYPTSGDVSSSPVVADGRVYVGSYDDNLYCLNAEDGSFIWSYPTSGNVHSSPVVADGRVYVGSSDDNLYCLNAEDGSFIWSYPTYGDVSSSPVVADGRVYVGSYDDNLYCLNAEDGSFIWSITTGDVVRSSPVVADGKVYVGSDDGNLYCLNAENGGFIWSYPTSGGVYSSPVVADCKVYVGSKDDSLYCIFTSRFSFYNDFDVSDSRSHSGDHSFYSGNAGMDVSSMRTDKPIPVTDEMVLSFWCWYNIESYDRAFVEVSRDGRFYDIISSLSGSSSDWEYKTYSLEDYVNESIFIRFRYTTHDSTPAEGFYVDDIMPVADYGTISTIPNSLINTDYSIINKPHGAYYYRVRGHNTERGWGDFSTLESIYVDKPPNKPTMDGPTSGYAHIEYNYTAITTDPDGDNISYGWDWDGDLIVDNWTTWYGSGENCTTSHSWENSGYYNVSVKVKDIYNIESNWSYPLYVLINSPPHMPSNPLPPNNATGVPVITNLSWNCSDPDGDPVTNDLYFGDSSPPPKVMNNLTNTSYNLSGLENGTKYYWQIVSWDGFGASTSGPIWIFSTVEYMQPEWRNQGQSADNIPFNGTITLYAEGRDGLSLDWTWLATNESGEWQNFTEEWGWNYYKQLDISNLIEDYQMPITVYKEDGYDDVVNGVIDCEDRCNANFSDLRFFAGGQVTSLPYWIEEIGVDNGDHYARIWVKTSSGADSIYMHYGNPDAAPVSNGTEAFPYFDHWTTDNTGDWVYGVPGYNYYHWWEDTKSFTFYRVLESKSMLRSWNAGDYDVTMLGWTEDKENHSENIDHVAVVWSMRYDGGASDSTVRIRLHIKNGSTTTTTPFISIDKPDPNHDLSLKLIYYNNNVSYEWKDLDTGSILASDSITDSSKIPSPSNVQYFYHGQYDSPGGIFSWLSPTYLKWGNQPGNGGCEWHTDYWFIRNYTSVEPIWNSFGNEQSHGGEGAYGSPMKMEENNQWQWSNFTWQNLNIPTGTTVGWRIYYQDTSGNVNYTDIMAFSIKALISVNISLKTGWNMITIPVNNTWMASTLAENITGCQMVSWFDAEFQILRTHIVGVPAYDFPIQDGFGYFILGDQNSTFSVSGSPLHNASVQLYEGWNMIGWYNQYNTTASSLAENITNCSMVSWFDAEFQILRTHIVGVPAYDFDIDCGMGLFILVDAESVWYGEG